MTELPPSAAESSAVSPPQVRHPRLPLRFRLRALGIEQALRLAWCFLGLALAEGAGRPVDWVVDADRRDARRAARRAAGARRVAATLGQLKGPFAKAGQFASLRYDLLAPEVREAFATLQDRVPPLPFRSVAAVIEAELGAPVEALFASFEPEPLGAASVAQVHRARLPNGEDVAVKVQFPWLEHSLRADLALAGGLLARLGRQRLSPIDRRRLFQEFAVGLAEELDFRHEADVAAEIAANLAHDPQVVVPSVHRALSARRVLTVGYLPAIPITDRDALARRGVPVRAVLETLARAYAKQVFVDGLFHADPHPGNLFVVDDDEVAVRPRVLFVDFGLSKRLSPRLRREMRGGIHALLRQDVGGFVDAMERMNMIAAGARDGVQAAVVSMFERIRREGALLGLGGAQVLGLKDEAKRLLAETPGLQLPNELLLYAKTLSFLFGLGEFLDPQADLMRISVPYLLRFLAERDGSARGAPLSGAGGGAGPAGG